jgi:hypothetical protein
MKSYIIEYRKDGELRMREFKSANSARRFVEKLEESGIEDIKVTDDGFKYRRAKCI